MAILCKIAHPSGLEEKVEADRALEEMAAVINAEELQHPRSRPSARRISLLSPDELRD